MNNRKAEDFLDWYRRLETAAQELMGTDSRSSPVMKLTRHRDFQKYREELDYARQVRNLLTHEAKINGQYGVQPSDTLLTLMEKIVTQLENPRVVGHVMTPVKDLLVTTMQGKLLPLMKKMEQRGLSHVPVLLGSKVTSVFSMETVFAWVLDQNAPFVNETVQDVQAYLPKESQLKRCYVFVPATLPVNEARDIFDRTYDQNCHIKLLLVTKNGTANSTLLGVVSPYDLLEKE